ncbi:MAG: type II toxin-antitoxin system HicB family antitoxin [Chloroflexi bacterium]|nr:type II toxin-antitoxin system HicB family antitoxin [Chloroflexota bacterium]
MASSSTRVKVLSLSKYVQTAMALAVYEKDENGVVVATVPNAAGFFAQGDTYEEARANLEDAIEGNVLLALQLGWEIPSLPGFTVEERDVSANPSF